MKPFTWTLAFGAGLALFSVDQAAADDPQKDTTKKPTATEKQAPKEKAATKTPDQDEQSSAEVMRLSQQAMTHISAAQQALESDDVDAARRSLEQSEESLSKLYDTPALAAVINEMDEAISKLEGDPAPLEPIDLAPLTATVRAQRVYLDPKVVAGVEGAAKEAKKGEEAAASEQLRLARSRMVADIAFLPVEEALVRVLAAQAMLEDKKTEQAKRVLGGLPIVVREVQVAAPLVPVRFKLQAAAAAAEKKNWDQATELVDEATTQIQGLENAAEGTPIAKDLGPLVDAYEKLDKELEAGKRPKAKQFRALAQRTRGLGE